MYRYAFYVIEEPNKKGIVQYKSYIIVNEQLSEGVGKLKNEYSTYIFLTEISRLIIYLVTQDFQKP